MFKTLVLDRLSRVALCGFIAAVAAVMVLPHFSLRIEDIQTALFPLILVSFYLLPRDARLRMPLPLAAAAAACWLFFTFELSGSLPRPLAKERVILGRLAGDADGLEARGFYQRFFEISRTYELTKLNLLQRSFASDAEARAFLASVNPAPFLIRGDARWHRVVFPKDARAIFSHYPALRQSGALPARVVQRAASYDVALDSEAAAFSIPGTTVSFIVSLLPEAVQVPGEPPELARHVLAWLGQALRQTKPEAGWPEDILERVDSHTEPQFAAEFRRAVRLDALREAANIDGLWQSKIPVGLAHYFLGTFSLFEGLEGTVPQPALTKTAIDEFRIASSLVDRAGAPELFAAIFNNAAGAMLASADSPGDYQRARRWLELAATTPPGPGSTIPPLGARAAMVNLLNLSLAGALP